MRDANSYRKIREDAKQYKKRKVREKNKHIKIDSLIWGADRKLS